MKKALCFLLIASIFTSCVNKNHEEAEEATILQAAEPSAAPVPSPADAVKPPVPKAPEPFPIQGTYIFSEYTILENDIARSTAEEFLSYYKEDSFIKLIYLGGPAYTLESNFSPFSPTPFDDKKPILTFRGIGEEFYKIDFDIGFGLIYYAFYYTGEDTIKVEFFHHMAHLGDLEDGELEAMLEAGEELPGETFHLEALFAKAEDQ